MLNPAHSVKRAKLDPNTVYRGVVIDNNHPDKNSMLRVHVPGVLEFDKPEHYPWCIPAYHHADGSTDHSGTVDVPKVNAFVGVMFQPGPDGEGSPYHPVWTSTNVLETTVLEDGKHHYPNRKVHRFANGTFAIIDTEDDSVWLCNWGETHVKSKGKLCIKSEETFVIISDVEVGVRAPEIALRAKNHLILESEGYLTMRSKKLMNIESRDDIWVLARRNIDMIAAEEQFRIYARCDKELNGDVIIHSAKDNVRISTDGDQQGRRSDLLLTARQHDVKVLAEARYLQETSLIDIRARKDTITVEAMGINSAVDRADILMRSKTHDVSVVAEGTDRTQESHLNLLSMKNHVRVQARGTNSPMERSSVYVHSYTHDVDVRALGRDITAKSRLLLVAEKNDVMLLANASNFELEDDANVTISARVYDVNVLAQGGEAMALRQPVLTIKNSLGPIGITSTMENPAARFVPMPELRTFGLLLNQMSSGVLNHLVAPQLQISVA